MTVKITLDMEALKKKVRRVRTSSSYKTAKRAQRIAQANARRDSGFMADNVVAVYPGATVQGHQEIRDGRLRTAASVTAPGGSAVLAGLADYTIFVERDFPFLYAAAAAAAGGAEADVKEAALEEGL